ncbi:MAG TPA: efflux RND transporter periplasmic adaptor subunit [Thermodesulfobacteriota bacterium]|nr:efflux RND transporter periplasmic adaptor subunit [Thermodesulfobacteriota bacterium]
MNRSREYFSRIIFYTARFGFLLGLAVFMISCSPKAKEQSRQARVAPVTVATAIQKDVPVQVYAIGNVEAYSTLSVKVQIGGELVKVYFKEGQFVKKGEPLFLIAPRPYEAALKQAEANLARDTAQAKNADMEARRYADLLKEGVIAQEQYDQRQTNAAALNAGVEADKAAVENARLQLEYCSIRSPIDGRTGDLKVDRGNIVKANDIPLVVITQITPIYVGFSVPEKELPEIKKYMASEELKVEVRIPESGIKPVSGKVAFVDNTVNTETGTILLKAVSPNGDTTLWPGQFVNVVLTLTTIPNAVLVPSQAVQVSQIGTYVFIVKPDHTANLVTVVVGRTYNGETVIEKGISPGDTVVTDGQLQLLSGKKVEIKNATTPERPAK